MQSYTYNNLTDLTGQKQKQNKELKDTHGKGCPHHTCNTMASTLPCFDIRGDVAGMCGRDQAVMVLCPQARLCSVVGVSRVLGFEHGTAGG